MPIEIRELVIKATVSSAAPGGAQQGAPATATGDEKVQQIIDAVLKKIKSKNER